jgi:hypothetical protein
MFVPVIHNPETRNDDGKELAAALKLLAGYECKRDAQQAHTMLVRLTESDRRDISEDARTVLSEGLRKDWFEDRKPFYQDLVALASKSGSGSSVNALSRISIPVGLMALIGGLVFFFTEKGGADGIDVSWVIIAIGVLVVALAGVFALKRY